MVASPNPYTNTAPGLKTPYQPGTSTQASAYTPNRVDRGDSAGGVSAVNPQAGQMDYASLQQFIDPAYKTAMTKLDPQLTAQKNKFDQDMVSRGIGVGSDAYNRAFQQMDSNQNDARQGAAFGAMQFGTGIQNQMFGQDQARSQLANALLQAQMQNDLGFSSLDEQGREFNDKFNQQGQQFGQELNERGRQFDESLLNNKYQYGDQSNYQWDRAQMGDLGWLANFDRDNQRYNDSQDWNFFNANQGILGSVPGWNPAMIDVAGNANSASNSQNNAFNAQNSMNQQAWSQITDLMGAAASGYTAYSGSDVRLKENIKPLGTIGGINIYRWAWNDKAKRLGIGKQPTIGVIAQEVPEEYTCMKDGYLAVNYEELFHASS